MEYKIAIGLDQGRVQNRVFEWDHIVKSLTTHDEVEEKGGRYFVGGAFSSPERKEENLTCRSMLTLDLDEADEGVNVFDLQWTLLERITCAFVAYSTFRHTEDMPRLRVIVPLSRDVTPSEYREVSRRFAETLGLKLDPCSFVPNQAMFMPQTRDLSTAWSAAQAGEPYQVPDDIKAVQGRSGADELDDAVANLPLDLSDDEVDAYLSAYDPEVLEYDQWLLVGAALHHQYEGSQDRGYTRWLSWSQRSSKHDVQHMPVKWRSFGRSQRRATFASVIYHVRQASAAVAVVSRARDVEGGADADVDVDGDGDGDAGAGGGDSVEAAAFERLAEDAAAVADLEAYDAIKRRIQQMSVSVLPLDKRAMLAQEIFIAWGRTGGLTKTDIKRELKPARKDMAVGVARSKVPEWARDWVYIEKTCEFYHGTLHYAIKREAFDSKYGREVEVIFADMVASKLVLNEYQIDTVVDTMFWPGAGLTFESDGKRMLNSYRDSGTKPCDVMDADGQSVVDLFMAHVRFTLGDVDEQRLLIDFLAWVVQNPGHKINWALLLQGAQGVGKSYFGVVMMLVLGEMARNIEPSALSGRFTAWAHGATLVIVEEIRVVSESRYEIIDRLKPFIANATVPIEEKGRDHRTVPNFTSYLMFTNHKDALPLEQGDRRYAPLFSRVQTEEQLFSELGGVSGAGNYFTHLFDESNRRPDALSKFLHDWQINPTFNAKGRAPHTRAREAMVSLAVSPERSMVEEAIDKYFCDVINDQILDVTWLNRMAAGEGDEMPKNRTLTAILLEMGYEQVQGRRVKIPKTRANHFVWHRGCAEETAKIAVKNYHGAVASVGLPDDGCPF